VARETIQRKEEGHYEGPVFSEKNLFKVQDYPPQGRGAGHLRELPPQAAAGVEVCHVRIQSEKCKVQNEPEDSFAF
jgi:hypothetical protein